MIEVADESPANDIDLCSKHIHFGFDGVSRCAKIGCPYKQRPAGDGNVVTIAITVKNATNRCQLQNHT